MYCMKCGQKLLEDAQFCSRCGRKINQSIEGDSNDKVIHLKCSSCGGHMTVDAERPVLICPYCGAADMLNESDDVAIQRLKSKVYRDVQLGQQQTEKDIELARLQVELEKAKTDLKKNKNSQMSDVWMIVAFFGMAALILLITLTLA